MNKLDNIFRQWIESLLIELINYFKSTIVGFRSEERKKIQIENGEQ